MDYDYGYDYLMDDDDDKTMDVEDATASDAEWKKIQKNTFTRWCNEHLKKNNLFIYSLETDLSDGLKLIALLEVLTHKKMSKYNRKPSFRPQKLENIAIALKFIENEQIKLVNIDAGDILKGNLKLILGLIWTLILKYQISIPMMDDFDDDEEGTKLSPKQALMGWVKSKLPPEVAKVKNFTTDWNDGIAVASLVDSAAPGLFPEWEALDPKNALDNAKDAMGRAEKWLGIPQVITPEEITNPNVDELSVMTYVSYFPEAKCKPGAPLKPKMTEASKCSAHGPGIQEHGVVVNKPADFTVNTTPSSGKLNVQVFGPGRKTIECFVQDNHDRTHTCRYTATKSGVYDVHIKVGTNHIPNSPFRVNIASDLDTSKVYAEGDGLKPSGVIVGRPAKFKVIATGAGSGDLVVDIIDPKGNKKTEVKVTDMGDNVFACEYMPLLTGRYVVVVKYGGAELASSTSKPDGKGSPFHINVTHAAEKVKFYGPGLEAGLKTGQPASFTIDCKDAGDGEMKVTVEGPSKNDIKPDVKDNGDGTYTCTYRPNRPGTHVITITFDGSPVPKVPHKVNIGSTIDVNKIKAWGSGLQYGVVDTKNEFFVSGGNTPLVNLNVKVTGPEGQVHVDQKSTNDGNVSVTYRPKKIGSHTIHITYDEVDIKDSPHTINVSAKADLSKVKAEGPGLTKHAMANTPCRFKVFTRESGGKGVVEVTVTDEHDQPVECSVNDTGDGVFSCEYNPKQFGKHTVKIYFQGQEVPLSPIAVNVQPYKDASKVRVTGPGLSGGKTDKPAEFKIDTSKAGDGDIGLTIEGPTEAEIQCDDHGDGTCGVKYFPTEGGEYSINVTFGGEHVPGSPFKPIFSSDFDASKVKVSGPGLEPEKVKAGRSNPIKIDARKAGNAKPAVEVVDDEVGAPVHVDVTESEPGIFTADYLPKKAGPHTVNVTFGGKPVPKSPFRINVKPASDASKVKLSGPGIEEQIIATEETYFEVDATEAGEGDVDIKIEPNNKRNPKVDDIKVVEGSKPKTYKVFYRAPVFGDYTINITFGGEKVPNCPIRTHAENPVDPKKVKVTGRGLKDAIVDQKASFKIDTKEAGQGGLGLTIEGPDEAQIDCVDNQDGTCTVDYVAKKPGEYDINIKFNDEHVPGSPFKAKAIHPVDAKKVKCTGDGIKKAVKASFPTNFQIDASKAGEAPVGVVITGPDKKEVPCKITDLGNNVYDCEFVPARKGKYNVSPTFGGSPVPGAPFAVTAEPVGDANKVKVTGPGVKRPHINNPAPFEIDCSKAGNGKPCVIAKGPKGEIPVEMLEPVEEGIVPCSYIPTECGPHELEVLFGGNPVKGSPFKANATKEPDLDKIKAPVLEDLVNQDHAVQAEMCAPVDCSDVPGSQDAIMTGMITTPSKKREPCDVKDNHDGTFALNYTPTEVGKYVLEVCYDGIPIPGSPFEFEVTEGGPDKVKVYGKGIKKGVVAVPARFTIDTKNAGPGNLSVAVEGPSKVDIDCVDNGDGTCEVTYVPILAGDYDVIVKFDDNTVPGSPFKPHIVQDEPAIETGRPSDLSMQPDDLRPADIPKLEGILQAPSGNEAPVEVSEGPNGSVIASFQPAEPGKNLLHLKKGNKPIKGSPVPIMVRDKPVIGADSAIPLECSDCQLPEDIPDLRAVLRRPNGKTHEIPVEEAPDKTIAVSFVPEEPGKHLIEVRKHGKEIEDSPFVVLVEGEPEQYPKVGKPCEKNYYQPEKLKPSDANELKAVLYRPSGNQETIGVEIGPDKTIAVSFVPTEAGEHLVSVKKNGRDVPNSPFSIMVIEEPQVPTVGSECAANFDIPDLKSMSPNELALLKGTLERPNGKEEPLPLAFGPDNSLIVNFVPTEPGPHKVSIKNRGKHVKDSPFNIMVEEAKPVGPTVGHDCHANLPGIPNVVLPKDLKHLTAELQRPNKEKREPLDLDVNEDNSLKIDFKPEEPGEHKIHVYKHNKPCEGSPFSIWVDDAPTASEEPVVGRECGVNLDIPEINLPKDLRDVKAELKRPSSSKKEKLNCTVGPDDTLAVSFTPVEEGKHLIYVSKNGKPVKNSPFEVMVGKEPKAKGKGRKPVTEDDAIMPSSVDDVHATPDFPDQVDSASPGGPCVGTPCDVNLDIDNFDTRDIPQMKATLTTPSKITEPVEVKHADNGVLVSFVPKEAGMHTLQVMKNNRPVNGSPFEILVADSSSEALKPTVGNKCALDVEVPNVTLPRDLKHLEATLTKPNGQKQGIECKQGPGNTLNLEFTPDMPGKHSIEVKKNNSPVKGSPFVIVVEGSNDKRVEPAQKKPKVGSPCDWTMYDIVIDEHQLKSLKGTLTRPGSNTKEPLELKLDSKKHLVIAFTPKKEGLHVIEIRRNNKHIDGSPIEVMVSAGKQPAHEVGFEIPGIKLPDDLKFLEGTVLTPSGTIDDVELQPGLNNKTIMVSFLPKEVGKHYINIKKNKRHVGDSPFEVIVKAEDIAAKADASKVKCFGKGLKSGKPKERCDFTVDTRDAGYGGLGLSVEGPSKVDINCVDNEDGTCSIDFTPAEEGSYLINVTYADEHVPGSPFNCRIGRQPVEEDISPTSIDDVQAFPDMDGEMSDMLAFPSSKPPQDFVIKFTGCGELSATVTRPSGIEDDAEVVETGPDTYTVRFVPRETGEHLVNVKSVNRHIPGSPFKVLVEAPCGGAKACKAYGPGLEEGVAGEQCRFTVVTRDAGPGGLAVAVEGPAKAEIQCHDNGDGSCDITWFPVEGGDYVVHIRFADEAIPGSPYKVVVQAVGEGTAMSMDALKEQVLRIGQQASFAVQMKGQKGKITAKVTPPSSAVLPCTVEELGDGNYAIKFTPQELGDHLVNVCLNGKDIPGSGFIVKVGGLEGDPSKCKAEGPGLKGGRAGSECEFDVDARSAGSGALALSIDGPHKVKMNCVEQDDGTYKVIYHPTVIGDYEISVRFAGQHIPGSPYKVKIPAGNVASNKFTNTFGSKRPKLNERCSFDVDTKGAGEGMIMVGAQGPKESCKEICVHHTSGSIYSVNYLLRHKGDHKLHVLWDGNHIPGSPFKVTV